jgi:hypothetical protein
MRIGIHPDDPPVPELGGVPRCIFGNFDGYVRALGSPIVNIGVCLCAGTWMEGGKRMGGRLRSAAPSPKWTTLEDSLSQRQRADTLLRRNLRGQRLHGHV